MKKKITKVLVFALILATLFGTVGASAFESYRTYTYDIDGNIMESPTAYSASTAYNSKTMGLYSAFEKTKLGTTVTDIVTDEKGNVYIVNPDNSGSHQNSRVVVLDYAYHVIASISDYTDEFGRQQSFALPEGVFVTDPEVMVDRSKQIYVCDIGDSATGALPKIVIFDENYNYVRTITKPNNPLLEDAAFKPSSIAVDKYGKIFVVSKSCYEGVIVLTPEGEFTGFIGAQKTTGSVLDKIMRRFKTKEQLAREEKNISSSYNNITVDKDGFVYVTSDIETMKTVFQTGSGQIDTGKVRSVYTKKDGLNSFVKKLNAAGEEVMKRNGYFDPSGEVAFVGSGQISQVVDIAIGQEGTWSILDQNSSRIFTYDSNGNLLFAFGAKGDQLGNGTTLVGLTYQRVYQKTDAIDVVCTHCGETVRYEETPEEKDAPCPLCNNVIVNVTDYASPVEKPVNYLLVLDKGGGQDSKITPYVPSVYCDTIMTALQNENNFHYDQSIEYWEEVLKRNNNLDLAYIGIGKALYSQEKYPEAMDMLKRSYETNYYTKAFGEYENLVISKWLLPIILGIIVLCYLLARFLGYAKKKNKATSLKVGRKTYKEELMYVFHLIFHPFDGFWDLKHEQRGSVRGGITILGITVLAFFYHTIGRSYLAVQRVVHSSILQEAIGVIAVVALWVIANWALTALFEGEGSLKDIFIATSYSVAPLPFFLIISTLLTHVLTDASIVNLLISIAYVWVGFLLFFGMLVTHDYSLPKNIIIVLCTLVAMMVIMFVILLFSSLCGKMVGFIVNLFTEIGDRI